MYQSCGHIIGKRKKHQSIGKHAKLVVELNPQRSKITREVVRQHTKGGAMRAGRIRAWHMHVQPVTYGN